MPNSLTWCDLPEDVSLWPGLPLSLSGDEVMPLDYHAGRSGWLLYGRGLDKRRLTAWQRELGAALVIVASWVVEDYQVIRLAGSLTPRATRLAHEAGLDVAPLGKIPHLRTPGLLVMDMDSTAIQIECIDEIAKLAGTGELVSEVTERAMRGELDFTASLRQRVTGGVAAHIDLARHTLGQINHHDTALAGLGQDLNKLAVLRRVADAIGAQDQRFDRLAQEVAHHVGGNAGINRHHANRLRRNGMNHQFAATVRSGRRAEPANVDAGFQQRRQVGRGEGVKAIGMGLRRAVAAVEAVIEEQRHFVNRVVGGDVQGVEQVNLAIRAQLGERNL